MVNMSPVTAPGVQAPLDAGSGQKDFYTRPRQGRRERKVRAAPGRKAVLTATEWSQRGGCFPIRSHGYVANSRL